MVDVWKSGYKINCKHCSYEAESLIESSVVFQALADGRSSVDGGNPSLHTQTARWVAEEILNVKFNASGHCKGIGFRAPAAKGPTAEKLAEDVARQLVLE